MDTPFRYKKLLNLKACTISDGLWLWWFEISSITFSKDLAVSFSGTIKLLSLLYSKITLFIFSSHILMCLKYWESNEVLREPFCILDAFLHIQIKLHGKSFCVSKQPYCYIWSVKILASPIHNNDWCQSGNHSQLWHPMKALHCRLSIPIQLTRYTALPADRCKVPELFFLPSIHNY